MSITPKIELRSSITCPNCENYHFTITQWHVDRNHKEGGYGPWYCRECHKGYRFYPKTLTEVDVVEVEITKQYTPAWVVATVGESNPPVHLILNEYIFPDRIDDPQESHSGWQYLIESHSCPSNRLNNKVEVQGDFDPHGVLKFIGIVGNSTHDEDINKVGMDVIRKAYVNHVKYINEEAIVPELYHSEELQDVRMIPSPSIDIFTTPTQWDEGKEIYKKIIDEYPHTYCHVKDFFTDGEKGNMDIDLLSLIQLSTPDDRLDLLIPIVEESLGDYITAMIDILKPYRKVKNDLMRYDLVNMALEAYEESRVARGAMSFKDIVKRAFAIV